MKTAKGELMNQNIPSFFRFCFSKSTFKVLRSALLIIRKKTYLRDGPLEKFFWGEGNFRAAGIFFR